MLIFFGHHENDKPIVYSEITIQFKQPYGTLFLKDENVLNYFIYSSFNYFFSNSLRFLFYQIFLHQLNKKPYKPRGLYTTKDEENQ